METCLISAGKPAVFLPIAKDNHVVRTTQIIVAVISSGTNIPFKEYISIIAFLRVQWEPFETQFGKVSSSFQHHLAVLSLSVQTLQYNAILDERQRAQQKDAGIFFSQPPDSLVRLHHSSLGK